MATWEDLDKLPDDDVEEEANLALMASTESQAEADSEPESDLEETNK
ncbi:hypothetical protein A2U01_0041215, partial [Trifolium medium]|nr:hypothetical protein [Trifolium medium]